MSTYNVNPGASSSTPSSGYTGGSGGGTGGRIPAYTPPATGPAPAADPFNGPGSIDFDLTDPVTAAEKAQKESGDLFAGLKSALFGSDTTNAAGSHGTTPFGVGDIPIVGDAGRAIFNVGGAVGGAVASIPGHIADLAGGTLEHISVLGDTERANLKAAFDQLPADNPAKAEALKQMEGDKGIAGAFSGTDHYMAVAVQKYRTTAQETAPNPDLFDGIFRPSASLADTVSNMFGGFFSSAQRGAERLWAGLGTPGQEENRNRLAAIMAVGDGHAVFNEDKGLAGTGILAGDPTKGLNPIEQIAYDNVKSGKWKETQALDFLASRNQGFSHAAIANVGGALALDPLNLATLGAGSLAKFGATGVRLAKALEESQAILKAAKAAELAGEAGAVEKVVAAERAVQVASSGIKDLVKAESVGSRDVLGKVAQSQRLGDVTRKYGEFYGSLEGTGFGRIAKGVRTAIDPMHAIGANPKAAAGIDEGSRQVTHAVISAHGEFTHIDTHNALRALDGGDAISTAYEEGMAVYAANVLRRVAGRQYRGVQMAMSDRGQKLIDTLPFDSIKGSLSGLKKRALVQLEEEAGAYVRGGTWAPTEDANLAERLAALWKGQDAEGWGKTIAKMSGQQKSLLHAASYGSAVKQLHAAKLAVQLSGEAGTFANRLHQLVLINKTTLTDLGSEGILTRMAAKGTAAERVDVIRAAMSDYPELRNFAFDPTSDMHTIEEFKTFLERKKNFLPSQITDAERPNLPGAMRQFDEDTRNVFTIGFRPKDEFLWGLEKDGDGLLHEVHDPWMDQVSDNLQAYSPVRDIPRNIAGVPVVGDVVTAGAKLLDASEAAARTAFHGVTGKMVSQAAHVKFVDTLATQYVHADTGVPLITKTEAEGVWRTLMQKVDDSENISGIRGLSRDAIWQAAKTSIPKSAQNAGLDRRALLVHIFDAYNGDVRYIGLTQKFSGNMKKALSLNGNINMAGQISEHAWPLLKFKLNPFFQLQEKIEPWVLNGQRAASIALGTKFSAKDKEAAALYRVFVEKDLINMADNDIAELGRRMGMGKGFENMARQEGSRGKAIAELMESLLDVQGVKQLNMLRTFRKGLGTTMKQNWEQNMPGEWQKMLDHRRGLTGSVISDDDYALHLAQSNLAANDVFIRDGSMHFENAIKEGQWAAPAHLGELQTLDMEYMVHRLGLTGRDGADITTNQGMREALASGNITQDEISRELRNMGAHKDYISRVESAYQFSWPRFWDAVQETYSLTAERRAHFEAMYTRIANRRGMTPTDYMSQVYSPNIGRGQEASIGSLGALINGNIERSITNAPDLGVLRGIQGQSDIQSLYAQMGAIMSAHLDPSAKRAFLLDLMDPHGDNGLRIRAARGEWMTDIADIEAAFNSGATDALSMRIMNYLQGQPGTGPHTLVANEADGIAAIRNSATEYRSAAGRPRNLQRTVHEDSPAQARIIADALDSMGEYVHVATQAELAEVINLTDPIGGVNYVARHVSADLKLYEQVPTAVKNSYQARVLESRKLYLRITKPKAEGGLGIKVTASRTQVPYTNADALRADLAAGKLKVPNSGHWHPLLKNEDVFIERVVNDVFGYGQEANALGSDDAIMSAAAMYSDEARSTLLLDGYARQRWATHSNQVIEQAVAEPLTIAEYEARWGTATDKPEGLAVMGLGGYTGGRRQTRPIGVNARAADPEVQKELVANFGYYRNQFPSVELHAWDIGSIPDAGVTLHYKFEHPSIVLSTREGWQNDPVERAARRAERLRQAEQGAQRPVVPAVDASGNLTLVPRKSNLGVPLYSSATPTGDLAHEFGHAVDVHLYNAFQARRGRVPKAGEYLSKPLTKFMKGFQTSEGRKMLSEYAFNVSPDVTLKDSDMFAELFDMAFNPDNEQVLVEAFGTALGDDVQNFRRILKDEGIWHPDGTPVPVNPHAGKTVAEANAAGAAIPAPFKMGQLPQDVLDSVTGHFIGSGRYAEANPDIGRMAGFMRNHIADVTGHTLEHDAAAGYSQFFNHMSGMPIDVMGGVPFDFTQAQLWHGAAQMMAAKWEDAFRLQYFAQNRSMFQRSINHPMFGLYPASYMWGKVGPEMIRFMALEPFGVKTGAGLRTLMDMQKSVAMQRKYDPTFDEGINNVGLSPAMSFLGYMLPATPWSVPASYPAYLRNLAEQGLKNADAFAAGREGEDINFVGPLSATIKKVFPLQTQLPWAARALGEVGGGLPWNQTAPTNEGPMHLDPTTGRIVPTLTSPVPEVAPPAPAPAGAPGLHGQQPGALTGPVTGLGTRDILAEQMADLSAMLAG